MKRRRTIGPVALQQATRDPGRRSAGSRRRPRYLAVGSEEGQDVVESKAPITSLAHAVEGQLAAIAEALHGVDVEVEELSDLAGGEHRAKLMGCHGRHLGSD